MLRSASDARYGRNAIPEDMTIQDWGVTYDDLEPHYDRFEKLCGMSGKAGNLSGTRSRAAMSSKVRATTIIRISR